MNGPTPGRPPSRTRAERQHRRAPAEGGRRRALTTVLARQAARARSAGAVGRNVLRALLVTVLAAVIAAPFALAWGIGHADVQDYLGPHRVRFATDYSGEVRIDLGPIGNAYLDSPVRPVGVSVRVGGLGAASTDPSALFSERTLAAYTSLYTDPQATVRGITDRLARQALVEAVGVEALLLLGFAGWKLRDRLLSPWVARHLTWRRFGAAYLAVVLVVLGSILAPETPEDTRYPVTVARDSRFASLSVDSLLLADVLDRGVKGIRLLAGRQQAAVQTYIQATSTSLDAQLTPVPRPGETMLLGFSDLHCNEATTELIRRLVRRSRPRLLLSSGDDTVNGTAAERGCIDRETAIATAPEEDGFPAVPFLVAPGNHDSDVTEAQFRSHGVPVLDGHVVETAGLGVLGDDDPEHNIPFSVERTKDRPETEEQLGQRMVDVARTRRTDVIAVHQPAASRVVMAAADPPARLVLWGHFHSQAGPTVVTHADGSWTVGMQQGTAGGVKQPTFTSFSTPFSPPLISADVYFYFRDDLTGLITGVQPVHFTPQRTTVIDERVSTGDLNLLPAGTRARLSGVTPRPTPSPGSPSTPAVSATPGVSAAPGDRPGANR